MEQFRGRRPGTGGVEPVSFGPTAETGEQARSGEPPYQARRPRRPAEGHDHDDTMCPRRARRPVGTARRSHADLVRRAGKLTR
ncbi:hypothetical protein [Streptomyces sp. NPDC005017]|uniref:hypothetical protein n=1 Tax=Streptomyces sp. NPDC005017 TaxID=3364706 RepID=UPI00369A8EAC